MASCRAMYSSAIPPEARWRTTLYRPIWRPVRSSRSDSSWGLPIPAGILPRPRVDFDGPGRPRANMRAVHIEIPRDASLDGHVVDGVLRYLTISTGIAFAVLLVVLAITLVR